MIKNIVLIFIITFSYSIIRYNIIGEILFSDIPIFIVNKAIAFSMMILLGIVVLGNYQVIYANDYLNAFKKFTVAHALLSIILIAGNYYPKIYVDDHFTLYGGIAILAGVVAFVIPVSLTKSRNSFSLLFLIVALHLFFIGFKSWFDVQKWPGFMPPISLISFAVIIIILYSNIKSPAIKAEK